MKLAEVYASREFGLSFELFPPKTEKGDIQLFKQLEELVRFEPSYITCTYGAGGSTRNKTLDVVQRVREKFNATVAAHLTCVGSTCGDLRSFLEEAHRRGVENIVALRGDPPRGETEFKAIEGGLRYANELVALIRAEFPQFGIAVAGYPEKHQEAPNPEIDLENLKRKVDAGADVVITQLFYDNADFFRFRDDCEKAGIAVPVVPGVLPITSLPQIKRITSMCGARLPLDLLSSLEEVAEDDELQFKVGVDFATRQVRELIESGVPGMHFYVLNKSAATAQILRSVTSAA